MGWIHDLTHQRDTLPALTNRRASTDNRQFLIGMGRIADTTHIRPMKDSLESATGDLAP